MSKVSPFSAFRLEDFADQRDWIGKLFLPLNTVLQEVAAALNGQVEFITNIPSYSKTLAGTNLSVPQSFQVTGLTPTAMTVTQAFKDGVAIAVIGAWSLEGDTITVSKLFEVSETGNAAISAGPKYQITLRFT